MSHIGVLCVRAVVIIVVVVVVVSTSLVESINYRPAFHFTPEKNWMNDPNGLIVFDGVYHMFYQYNPYGNLPANQSWGHAVSKDLMNWGSLPVALYEEDGVLIFSGSAVQVNSSEMVLVYTGMDTIHNKQTQDLAFSYDSGVTFTKYKYNPVLDLGLSNFRDPKVFWYEDGAYWIMAVVVPYEFKVQFYQSSNLKEWKFMSEFSSPKSTLKGIWECPDLFRVNVDDSDLSKWVLLVSVGVEYDGTCTTQYFIGDFDGREFKVDDSFPLESQRLDYGSDYYAAVTFNGMEDQNRRVSIGWAGNWNYAAKMPTGAWRGYQSVPRVIKLRRNSQMSVQLYQQPVRELSTVLNKVYTIINEPVLISSSNDFIVNSTLFDSTKVQLDIEFKTTDFTPFASMYGLKVFSDERSDEYTTIALNVTSSQVFLDRRKSGVVNFDDKFLQVHSISPQIQSTNLHLTVLLDKSVIEVYINHGEVCITALVFPIYGTGIRVFCQSSAVDKEANIVLNKLSVKSM